MDEDASPDRLVFLIKISGCNAKNSSTEHHGKFITHMEDKEEKSCHPDREMLIVFLAGCSDVILYNSLYKEFLQDSTDGIEPAHISREIKTEPGPCSDIWKEEILNDPDHEKDTDESHADYAADYQILLKSVLARCKAFEMDLEPCEYSEKNRQYKEISFHHSCKDISIIFYKGCSDYVGKKLDGNNLAGNGYQ